MTRVVGMRRVNIGNATGDYYRVKQPDYTANVR